jgi:hypothetical protein
MGTGALYLPGGCALERFGEAIAWLWRLRVVTIPEPDAVGLGTAEELGHLDSLLESHGLAGIAIFDTRPGPDQPGIPGRQRLRGVARFSSGVATQGDFTLLHGRGDPVATSSLGTHALRSGRRLWLGCDPLSSWGTLQHFWAFPALAEFLADTLDRPMAMLPPIGMIRYDDVPGTAAQQIAGREKHDLRVVLRLRRLLATCERANAKLNVAVASHTLRDEREVPLESLWPRSVEAVAEAVAKGTAEQVCHGYLHLDRARSTGASAEPREFARLDRKEAGRRIQAALEWGETRLGARPRSFVAPNWAYSEGALSVLSELELPAWLPVRPGPLTSGLNARETLTSTLDGLQGVDYGPLAALASVGVPPVVVIHGGLLDGRFQGLHLPRDVSSLARLALRRDLLRLPKISGLRWVGSSELIARLQAHNRVEVTSGEIQAPEGAEVIAGPAGTAAT